MYRSVQINNNTPISSSLLQQLVKNSETIEATRKKMAGPMLHYHMMTDNMEDQTTGVAPVRCLPAPSTGMVFYDELEMNFTVPEDGLYRILFYGNLRGSGNPGHTPIIQFQYDPTLSFVDSIELSPTYNKPFVQFGNSQPATRPARGPVSQENTFWTDVYYTAGRNIKIQILLKSSDFPPATLPTSISNNVNQGGHSGSCPAWTAVYKVG